MNPHCQMGAAEAEARTETRAPVSHLDITHQFARKCSLCGARTPWRRTPQEAERDPERLGWREEVDRSDGNRVHRICAECQRQDRLEARRAHHGDAEGTEDGDTEGMKG